MSVSLVRKPIFLISQKCQSGLSSAECSPSAEGVSRFPVAGGWVDKLCCEFCDSINQGRRPRAVFPSGRAWIALAVSLKFSFCSSSLFSFGDSESSCTG